MEHDPTPKPERERNPRENFSPKTPGTNDAMMEREQKTDKETRDRDLTIEIGPELALKLVTQEDADRILQLVKHNREFLKQWISWADERYDEDFNQKFIQNNLDAFDAGTAYAMGIYADGELIGVVDIRNLDGGTEEPEIGYWLEEAAQGKGYATRSARALIDYAQRQHGIEMVVLHTKLDNDASSGVAERLGFRLIGEHVDNDSVHEKRYELEL